MTDVNSVCCSHNKKLVATTEESGLIKLFRYPCADPRAACREFNGHGTHPTRAIFSANDKYLVSIGGTDRTLLVWEIKQEEDDKNEGDAK